MTNTMRMLGVAMLAGSLFDVSGTAFAQKAAAGPTVSKNVTTMLAGSAVSDHELRGQTARGLPADMYGSVQDNTNTAGGGGTISDTNAITNNSGITTVFQNTGNNSLFQNQTVINVSIH
jgi:hypothetical protein